MTWYREIGPMEQPFDPGDLDEKNRAGCIFNILAVKAPSNTFVEELVKLLETAGVGRKGISIFVSSAALLPVGVGPYLLINETGGTSPLRVQNKLTPWLIRPSAKLTVRASTYFAARAMAQAAYDALAPVRNQEVVP